MDKEQFQYSKIEQSQLDSLANFFNQVYKQSLNYGSKVLFNWKIFENLNPKGFIHAAHFQDEIVSTTSITPKKLHLNQDPISVAEIGDTYTLDRFQRKGLFANLVNSSRSMAQEQGINFVYGTPNNNSLPGYLKKCDFVVVDSLAVKSMSFPLSTNVVFKNKIPLVLVKVLDSLFHKILKIAFSVPLRNLTIEIATKFDERHDQLWLDLMKSYDFIFVKDRSHLDWRFVKNPYKYTIYNLNLNNRLIGTIVTRPSENNDTLFIAEYLCHKDSIQYFRSAIKKIVLLNLGKHQRINVWTSIHDFVFQSYKDCFFQIRNPVTVIAHKNDSLKGLENIKQVHFSISDSDNI